MRTLLPTVLFIAAFQIQPTIAAEAQSCAEITVPEVEALFERWNTSLATLDAKKVAENYSKNSVLLATLANDPRVTDQARTAYFEEFLKKKPQGKINSRAVQLGCNWAVDVGTYTFTMNDGSTVPARYTYTYEYQNNNWLITSHHSSMMPEKL